jgi:hypothetical protein
MRIPAVLSIVGCLAVMVTFFTFPKLRQLRYVEFVFYVALNDFLASIEVCLGSQLTSGSALCYIQGIGTGWLLDIRIVSLIITRNVQVLISCQAYSGIQPLRTKYILSFIPGKG